MATKKSTNIHEAINAVMQEVGYVRKQSSGDLNYTYAGERALIQALRPAMVEHGIYVYPSGIDNLRLETYKTSRYHIIIENWL